MTEHARTQSESVPSTSEDCDLVRKYEHLPLSELITADKSISIKSFTEEEFVTKTWAIVVRASEEVKKSLAEGFVMKVSMLYIVYIKWLSISMFKNIPTPMGETFVEDALLFHLISNV